MMKVSDTMWSVIFLSLKNCNRWRKYGPRRKKKKKENSHTNLSSYDCECMTGCNTFSVDTACEVYQHGCKFKIMTVFVSFYQFNSDRWPVHLIVMLADAAGQNPDVTLVLAAEGPCGLVTHQLLPVVRHMLSAEGSQNCYVTSVWSTLVNSKGYVLLLVCYYLRPVYCL